MPAAHVVVPLGLLHAQATEMVHLSVTGPCAALPQTSGDTAVCRNRSKETHVSLCAVSTLAGWHPITQSLQFGSIGRIGRPSETQHINLLDLEAFQLILYHFASVVKDWEVLVRSDNSHCCLHQLARRCTLTITSLPIKRSVVLGLYTPALVNNPLMSRGGPKSDKWRLNPHLMSQIWKQCCFPRLSLSSWDMSTHWCGNPNVDPVYFQAKTFFKFLQSLFNKGRAAGTIYVYVAAILVCHEG